MSGPWLILRRVKRETVSNCWSLRTLTPYHSLIQHRLPTIPTFRCRLTRHTYRRRLSVSPTRILMCARERPGTELL